MIKLKASGVIVLLFVLAGCGGSGGRDPVPAAGLAIPNPGLTNLEIQVADVTGTPMDGVSITVTAAGEARREATTDANGSAAFADLPNKETTISLSAAGFEPQAVTTPLSGGIARWGFSLDAEGAWAIGRAIVLGTDMVARAADGSSMTFSVDVAVVDGNSEPLETLTSAQFSVIPIDCGWVERQCASDADGNATGSGGSFAPDSDAQAFELRPPAARQAYLAGVLVERSDQVRHWDQQASALRSFFTALGGNDSASLATVQTENGAATLSVLGPFTNDGSVYFDTIDQLENSDTPAPVLLNSLTQSIRRAEGENPFGIADLRRHVLVVGTSGLLPSEIDQVTVLARDLEVHVSTIGNVFTDYYGLPEAAVRTGGFAVQVHDPRQFDLVAGALDRLLGGSLPFYRMQFRLMGVNGTFVPGGNAKVSIRVDVPAAVPNVGVHATLDVAIR